MKEKEQSMICVDGKKCSDTSTAVEKEIVDDSCFKTPLHLPPRKGGRRRGSALRNGQINHDLSRATLVPKVEEDIEKKSLQDGVSTTPFNPPEIVSCSCSSAYIAAAFPDSQDRLPELKETIIDGFSLFLFKTFEDLKMFQVQVNEAKAKEDALERKRQYEENVRLGIMKKKGRKSKAQIEKERREEKRRLKRERKAERARRRKERRERESLLDPAERKLRKERRRRKREEKERRRREREERRKLEAANDGVEDTGDRKMKVKKLKESNAAKKARQVLINYYIVVSKEFSKCIADVTYDAEALRTEELVDAKMNES
uniref:INCENP_ARK-bind domain-containing protein n=1 Tax=Syphacia muris TaxID=451379 RepID=A0A0N5AWZ1_9BILA